MNGRPNTIGKLQRRIVLAAFIVAVPIAGGCGSSDGRRFISGTVSVDGQPLKSGLINFRPDSDNAPSAGSSIVEGEFSIPAESGPLPGRYLVTVEGYRQTGKIFKDPQRGPVPVQVPIEFQDRLPFEATVTADGNNHFEFKLKSAR